MRATKADIALGLVLAVACLTEDRSTHEQRAMLDTALRLDLELGSLSIANKWAQRPRFTRMVMSSYRPTNGRRVQLTGKQREHLTALEARWAPCDECGLPVGAHYVDSCPFVVFDIERLREAMQR